MPRTPVPRARPWIENANTWLPEWFLEAIYSPPPWWLPIIIIVPLIAVLAYLAYVVMTEDAEDLPLRDAAVNGVTVGSMLLLIPVLRWWQPSIPVQAAVVLAVGAGVYYAADRWF